MTPLKSRRKIMVVTESQSFFDNVTGILPKSDFFPIFHATSGGDARRKLLELPVDILIVDSPLSDEHGTIFSQSFAASNMGILLLVKADMYDSVACQVEEDGIVTLPKPNSPEMFYTAVRMLSAMTFRLQKLETQNKTLQEKMADIRSVNKAKWVLIENLKMTEADAHRYIEKRAMDARISRKEVAEEIIRSYSD